MLILFTGHRNLSCDPSCLANIASQYPGATWVHGGSKGFDSQVAKFAKANKINALCYPPQYNKYGKAAPLIRNRTMVSLCNIVFALYDGRGKGGTYYTINQANKAGKQVHILPVHPN